MIRHWVWVHHPRWLWVWYWPWHLAWHRVLGHTNNYLSPFFCHWCAGIRLRAALKEGGA